MRLGPLRKPTMQERCYEQVIIDIGINDQLNRTCIEITVSNLQKNIVDICQKCVTYGADKIFISGLIHAPWLSHI